MLLKRQRLTIDGISLCHLPEVEQDAWPRDGRDGGGEQEAAVDGSHVLGPVQVGLVGRQAGERAAHDGDGGHGGGAEGAEVVGGQRTWVLEVLEDIFGFVIDLSHSKIESPFWHQN